MQMRSRHLTFGDDVLILALVNCDLQCLMEGFEAGSDAE